MTKLVLENKYKIVVPLFGAAYAAPNKGTKNLSIKLLCLYLVQHMLHQIKAQKIYNDLGLYQLC